MKTDDILPSENGNFDDGNGDGNGTSGSSSGSGNVGSGVVGTIDGTVVSGSGNSASGTSRKADGASGESSGGDDELPLGSDGTSLEIGSGTGSKRKRNASNSGGSARRSGNRGSAEIETERVSTAVPRDVKIGTARGKSSPSEIKLSHEFVSEAWGILFHGASLALRDPDWKLEEDDASELAERTVALLKSLDKKSAERIEKRIAKYAPSLSLAMALVAIVGPRVANTRSKRRAVNLQKQTQTGSGTRVAEGSTSAPNTGSQMAGRPSGNGNGQPVEYAITPLRGQDRFTVSGLDDA